MKEKEASCHVEYVSTHADDEQGTHADLHVVHGEDVAAVFHVLFQVAWQELKDQCERVSRMDDVMQCHDVVMTQSTKQGHLTNGGTGCTLFVLQSDLLESNVGACHATPSLEDGRVRAFAQLVQLDVRLLFSEADVALPFLLLLLSLSLQTPCERKRTGQSTGAVASSRATAAAAAAAASAAVKAYTRLPVTVAADACQWNDDCRPHHWLPEYCRQR